MISLLCILQTLSFLAIAKTDSVDLGTSTSDTADTKEPFTPSSDDTNPFAVAPPVDTDASIKDPSATTSEQTGTPSVTAPVVTVSLSAAATIVALPSLRLESPITVPSACSFNVRVTSEEGKPIHGAFVDFLVLYVSNEEGYALLQAPQVKEDTTLYISVKATGYQTLVTSIGILGEPPVPSVSVSSGYTPSPTSSTNHPTAMDVRTLLNTLFGTTF